LRIEARAPTRIDLAGGTLDIWPLYLFHQGALTLNCAITRYASCTVETPPAAEARRSERIVLISRDTRCRESFPGLDALVRARRSRLPLLANFLRFFQPRTGLALTTDSEAPAGAGIGGSSAMAVAICAALDRLTHSGLSREHWVHLCRDVECMVIGVPTGTQDHYPAVFGGASAVHLEPGRERREALRIDLETLERRLLLCYTGKPRQSAINNWEVFKAHLDQDRGVWRNLEQITAVARSMRAALEQGRWEEVGRLVREEWEFRRGNLPTISTPRIDRIIAAARRNGALGGKVCGAGGGGCVALIIEPEARVRAEAAVRAAGGEILPGGIDRRGVRVEVKRQRAGGKARG
jgi:D-glycero-alpha-D-manno-heptose-7-phosphate kinase